MNEGEEDILILESEEQTEPLFMCKTCSFSDFSGMFLHCPFCEKDAPWTCAFLRPQALCGFDGTPCPHREKETFSECHKLVDA